MEERRNKEKDHCGKKLLKELEARAVETSGRNVGFPQKKNTSSRVEAKGMKINMNVDTSVNTGTELGHCQEPQFPDRSERQDHLLKGVVWGVKVRDSGEGLDSLLRTEKEAGQQQRMCSQTSGRSQGWRL